MKTSDQITALLLACLALMLCGCQSGHVSQSAYPASVANEPVLWIENGKTWIIDRDGVREIK